LTLLRKHYVYPFLNFQPMLPYILKTFVLMRKISVNKNLRSNFFCAPVIISRTNSSEKNRKESFPRGCIKPAYLVPNVQDNRCTESGFMITPSPLTPECHKSTRQVEGDVPQNSHQPCCCNPPLPPLTSPDPNPAGPIPGSTLPCSALPSLPPSEA